MTPDGATGAGGLVRSTPEGCCNFAAWPANALPDSAPTVSNPAPARLAPQSLFGTFMVRPSPLCEGGAHHGPRGRDYPARLNSVGGTPSLMHTPAGGSQVRPGSGQAG